MSSAVCDHVKVVDSKKNKPVCPYVHQSNFSKTLVW